MNTFHPAPSVSLYCPLRLIVVHFHLRPGGVRRVIELATPFLARGLEGVREIVLASGEQPDPGWFDHFQREAAPVPVICRVEPALGYLAEQRLSAKTCSERLRRFLFDILSGPDPECVVWAHNQGLGRNLLLTQELRRACEAPGRVLVFHHHDWWFDNRWKRWPEMRSAGFRTLAQVAGVVFGQNNSLRHAAINHADTALLAAHSPNPTEWIPNMAQIGPAVARASARQASAWLQNQLGSRVPVWLMPCRLLRRKNIAEALLLTRWLRPDACLVTTGSASSSDETAYADQLAKAAREHGWNLRLSILQGRGEKPSVSELMAASEVVLLTSLQEGFGLPYLEAASAGKPLIARALGNIMPDLKRFGFRFPHAYEEVLVDPALYDWKDEVRRQRRLYARWRAQLPSGCRDMAGVPWLLQQDAEPRPVPFNRLTTTAQLQVLTVPCAQSWELCAPLNPFLRAWRELAKTNRLRPTPWPAKADQWLSGEAYARRFRSLIKQPATLGRSGQRAGAAMRLQRDFLRQKLAADNLYPLTWSLET